MTSKIFWRTVKPFLTNNDCIFNYFTGIENDGNLICNKQKLVDLSASQDEIAVKETISVYSNNHPSIRKIKNSCVPENKFGLPYTSTSDINKIIKSLNVNKAKGQTVFLQNFLKCHQMLLIVI